MPKKKNKPSSKKGVKASAKITNSNRVNVEIHHHKHRKHSTHKNEATPKIQYVPMGGGGGGSQTVVNNIPSNDFPQLQQMHALASYQTLLSNLASEVQALKLSNPNINPEAVNNHVQLVKNAIDETVKPNIKLKLPTNDTKSEDGSELLMNYNGLYSGLTTPVNEARETYDVDGMKKWSDMEKIMKLDIGGDEQVYSYIPNAEEKAALQISKLGKGVEQSYSYIPSAEEKAALQIQKANVFDDRVKRPLLVQAAKQYGNITNDEELINLANSKKQVGSKGFYNTFENVLNAKTTNVVNNKFENPIISYDWT